MVGGVEAQNSLAVHKCVAYAHQEGYFNCGGPTSITRGPSLTLELPRPRFQCYEEESTQNMAVKINRNSGVPLKSLHTDLLTHKHWMGNSSL